MPFAIGIPLGGTLRLTSYCPKDSFGERIRQLAEKSKYVPVFQNPLLYSVSIHEAGNQAANRLKLYARLYIELGKKLCTKGVRSYFLVK
jgi:hypothetical protein